MSRRRGENGSWQSSCGWRGRNSLIFHCRGWDGSSSAGIVSAVTLMLPPASPPPREHPHHLLGVPPRLPAWFSGCTSPQSTLPAPSCSPPIPCDEPRAQLQKACGKAAGRRARAPAGFAPAGVSVHFASCPRGLLGAPWVPPSSKRAELAFCELLRAPACSSAAL